MVVFERSSSGMLNDFDRLGSERRAGWVGGGERGKVFASLIPLPFSSSVLSIIAGREVEVVFEYLSRFASFFGYSSTCACAWVGV